MTIYTRSNVTNSNKIHELSLLLKKFVKKCSFLVFVWKNHKEIANAICCTKEDQKNFKQKQVNQFCLENLQLENH